MNFLDFCQYVRFKDKHPADYKENRIYTDKPDPSWKSYGVKYPVGYFKLDVDDYNHKTEAIEEPIHEEPRSEFILQKLHDQGIYPPYLITPHGKQFIFRCRSEMEHKTKPPWISAINIKCEWKFPESDDHIPLMVNGIERKLIDADKDVPVCPKWLIWIQKSRNKPINLNFEKGDRTNPLGAYVLWLTSKKGFTQEEAFQVIEIINESFDDPIPCDLLYSQILNESTAVKCQDMEEQHRNSAVSPEVFGKFLQSLGMSIRYNELLNIVEYNNIPTEADYQEITDIQNVMPIKLMYEFRKFTGKQNITKHQVIDLILLEADTHTFNPVKEYLQSSVWDGSDRFPDLFKVLGVTDDLQKSFIRKWFYQTAGMPFNTMEQPFQAEGVLILQGAEGIGKTRFFQQIAVDPLWFSSLDKELTTKNKDILIQMLSVWIAEIGEVDRTFKANKSDVKSFITSRDDTIRKPYRMEQVKKARTTSFCGTTNKITFLNDDTGSRRWWVIPVKKKIILGDFAKKENLLQFWSQCYHAFCADHNCFRLTDEEQEHLKEINRESMELLPAEEELRNRFDFEAPETEWNWMTASTLKNLPEYDVDRYTVQQIGKALTAISQDDDRIKQDRGKAGRLWFIPPVIGNTDRYRNRM